MRGVLYDVESGEVIYTLPVTASRTVFSADGTFIVTQSDPLTTIWTIGE
jgi:hypothetical protein